ncbi:unnamed protein product [Chrysodeixis includens]|uniref:Uncharacterized protein n=1 Tax=Chrysodeixis includens TaxID=689277 RepID=A0A9P0BN62_CHRIL|nr:unnamed protein product [Chrysodeixis includens]
MYDVPGDYLLPYDSKYTELHTDSSDFEDSCPAPVTPKLGNHSLIKRKIKSKRKISTASFNVQAGTVTNTDSREMWESQTIISQDGQQIDLEIRQKYQNRQSKVLDSGDQIETIRSRRSLMRHKVIPCISSMFGRPSNNVKQMSIIKENQAENVNLDNGCQASRVNREHKIRKFNRRQPHYAVQPVYSVEGNFHTKPARCQHTKIIREPLTAHRMVENQYTNVSYSLTSSSEATGSRKFMQRKKGKYKKDKMNASCDMEEEYNTWCQQGPTLKHREQQCSSNMKRAHTPYHVYTTPYHNQYQQKSNTGCSPIGSHNMCGSELPSTCSGFWEYLFNKINSKYQNETGGSLKPCKCNNVVEKHPCEPINCEKFAHSEQQNNSPPVVDECGCAPSNKGQSKGKSKGKVECKCYEGMPPCPSDCPHQSQASAPSAPTQFHAIAVSGETSPKPCQMQHDEIIKNLKQKYNGEILCIHNPPCVLINGCLNLPATKEKVTDMWPVLHECNGYQIEKQSDDIHYGPDSYELRQCQITDESCQYFPPSLGQPSYRNTDESCQCQVPHDDSTELMITEDGCQYRQSQYEMLAKSYTLNEGCQYCSQLTITKTNKTSHPKREKIIQSICSHSPPCEVVRTCKKPKYDPRLQNSCVHVPMCEKVPMCLMDLKNHSQCVGTCPHKPKCAELPICTRNYIMLTAREEAATQVRPRTKMVCRHEPPCVMIPTCLARVCDAYMPCDAIPDCVHQPMCEMIPACCRKTGKEMSSLSVGDDTPIGKQPKVPIYYQNKLLRMMNIRRSKK